MTGQDFRHSVLKVKAAIKTLHDTLLNSSSDHLSRVHEVQRALCEKDPHDPLIHNSLLLLTKGLGEGNIEERFVRNKLAVLKHMEEAEQRISDIGASKIKTGSHVFVSGLSHEIDSILSKATQDGKKFIVNTVEGRGHASGKELCLRHSSAIRINYFLDSSVLHAIKASDFCLLGADAILGDIGVISRTGSGTAAILANHLGVPIYACGVSLRYTKDHGIRKSLDINIEKEHIEDLPRKASFRNPRHEMVSERYLNGIVTDLGIMSQRHQDQEIRKHLSRL